MIKDCSSLLALKGRFHTLTDNQKRNIILSLAIKREIDISDEIRNELITEFLEECPDYTEFYKNIKDLNSGLEDIIIKYSSIV